MNDNILYHTYATNDLKTSTNKLKALHSDTIMESDNQCVICFEEFDGDKNLAYMDCGHKFHFKCILKWNFTENGDSCPLCRQDLGLPSDLDSDSESDEDNYILDISDYEDEYNPTNLVEEFQRASQSSPLVQAAAPPTHATDTFLEEGEVLDDEVDGTDDEVDFSQIVITNRFVEEIVEDGTENLENDSDSDSSDSEDEEAEQEMMAEHRGDIAQMLENLDEDSVNIKLVCSTCTHQIHACDFCSTPLCACKMTRDKPQLKACPFNKFYNTVFDPKVQDLEMVNMLSLVNPPERDMQSPRICGRCFANRDIILQRTLGVEINENGEIDSTVSSDKLNHPEIKALYYNLYYDNAGINNQRIYQKYPAYHTYNVFKTFAIEKFGLEVDQVDALRMRGLHPAYPDHPEPIFVPLNEFMATEKN